jgi:uncharacterized protein (TIGR03083 family)
MTQLALEGLAAERDDLVQTLESLDESEWNAASGAPGWRVRDLVAHVAATHHGVVDPSVLPGAAGNEGRVDERRAWSIEQVFDELVTYTAESHERFAAAQQPPQCDRVMTMGAFGAHPASSLADLYLFDLYGHFRVDLLAPLGRAEPPRDEARLRPTVEWMMAALSPMCGTAIGAALAAPVTIELVGAAAGSWTIAPAGEGISVRPGADPDSIATIASSDHDFVVWASERRPWRTVAVTRGDAAAVGRALDAIRVF